MAVCHTVFEIFSIKEWRDLETGVGVIQGHWKWRCSIYHIRLSKFYWSAVVSIAVYCTIFKLFDVQ